MLRWRVCAWVSLDMLYSSTKAYVCQKKKLDTPAVEGVREVRGALELRHKKKKTRHTCGGGCARGPRRSRASPPAPPQKKLGEKKLDTPAVEGVREVRGALELRHKKKKKLDTPAVEGVREVRGALELRLQRRLADDCACIRQHTSAYVSIPAPAYVSIRQRTSAALQMTAPVRTHIWRQHTSAYVIFF
jgi:hypothetical protein